MCYTQLGLEFSGFIGDALCCVLFKVKQRTMKKIQAILNSCKTQDKGSVKHSSIFSFPKMEKPQGCILANTLLPQ